MNSVGAKTAETNFREAFERLKMGSPKLLQADAQVTQNNVAKEAGCDPSALRKSRFPSLVAEIQNYVAAHEAKRPHSERQKILKQRQQSRSARETIADLKRQRDAVTGLLVEANAQIGILTRRLRDAEARLDSNVITMKSGKPRSHPHAMDTM